MVLDSAPHPLSILLRLVSYGSVRVEGAEYLDRARSAIDLRFDYLHGADLELTTSVRCRFATRDAPPRPASYAINGKVVAREIALPDYTMELVSGDGARLRIDDPLERFIGEFLGRVERGEPLDRTGLIQGITDLETLLAAAEDAA